MGNHALPKGLNKMKTREINLGMFAGRCQNCGFAKKDHTPGLYRCPTRLKESAWLPWTGDAIAAFRAKGYPSNHTEDAEIREMSHALVTASAAWPEVAAALSPSIKAIIQAASLPYTGADSLSVFSTGEWLSPSDAGRITSSARTDGKSYPPDLKEFVFKWDPNARLNIRALNEDWSSIGAWVPDYFPSNFAQRHTTALAPSPTCDQFTTAQLTEILAGLPDAELEGLHARRIRAELDWRKEEICNACGVQLVHVAGDGITAKLCPVCDADSPALQEGV